MDVTNSLLFNFSTYTVKKTAALLTHMAWIAPGNPIAFPPSLEVRGGKCRGL
jgi:hypothetical protein